MKCTEHEQEFTPDCQKCVSAAENDIWSLPVDYFDLKRDLGRKYGAAETKIARPAPGSAPPIDLQVDALSRSIAWTLTTWEPAVREAAGLPDASGLPVREGFAVSVAARIIAPRVAILAGIDAIDCYADGPAYPVPVTGAEALARLRRLHRAARATLGLTQVVIALPGACSAGCRGATLRRVAGRETVWCAACERRWTYDDYRTYVGLGIAAEAA